MEEVLKRLEILETAVKELKEENERIKKELSDCQKRPRGYAGGPVVS